MPPFSPAMYMTDIADQSQHPFSTWSARQPPPVSYHVRTELFAIHALTGRGGFGGPAFLEPGFPNGSEVKIPLEVQETQPHEFDP